MTSSFAILDLLTAAACPCFVFTCRFGDLLLKDSLGDLLLKDPFAVPLGLAGLLVLSFIVARWLPVALALQPGGRRLRPQRGTAAPPPSARVLARQ